MTELVSFRMKFWVGMHHFLGWKKVLLFYVIVTWIRPVFARSYLRSGRIRIQTRSGYIGSGRIQIRAGSTKFTGYPAGFGSGSGAPLVYWDVSLLFFWLTFCLPFLYSCCVTVILIICFVIVRNRVRSSHPPTRRSLHWVLPHCLV